MVAQGEIRSSCQERMMCYRITRYLSLQSMWFLPRAHIVCVFVCARTQENRHMLTYTSSSSPNLLGCCFEWCIFGSGVLLCQV